MLVHLTVSSSRVDDATTVELSGNAATRKEQPDIAGGQISWEAD
ncbi:hypothetical protein [Xenorhabdus kozodoii]|nr:hypothetical protein [Xenorhabdus kozodoii]